MALKFVCYSGGIGVYSGAILKIYKYVSVGDWKNIYWIEISAIQEWPL